MLGLDKTGFDTGLNSATKKTTLFKKASDATFKAIQKSIKIAFIASTAIVLKGVADWKKYEAELANVSTMLNKKTMPMMKQFEKGMLSMSQEFGESTTALSKGLYDILSASIPATEAMDVLEVSAMAAKAGVTDTGVAADALTTLMNSFADSTKDANYYADIMFATTKLGKTTFAELAGTVGNVATLFSTVGGSAEELAGMLSQLTRRGVPTTIAMTNVKGVVSALLKPTDELSAALNGMTVETDGFAAVMKKVGGIDPIDLAKMFPNVRALGGIVIAAEGLSSEVETINKMMAEGSPAQIAFNKQTQTLDYLWNQLKATLKATSIIIGKEVAPQFKILFAELTAWFQDNQGKIAEFFKGFVDTISGAVKFVVDFKDVILGLGVAIATLSILDKATKAIAILTSTTALGLGPIAAVAAAVGLLVYALVKVNKISKEYQTAQENMDKAMSGAATSVEEYDAGLTAAQASLDLLEIKQAQNIATLKTLPRITQANIDIQISQDKIAVEAREREMRLMTKNKDLYISSQEQKAEAEKKRAAIEMQNQLDLAAGVAQEHADKIALTAAEELRLAQILEIKKAIAESQMSAEEKYNAEIEKLEELGLTAAEVTAYMKIQFKDLYEAIQEEGEEAAEVVEKSFISSGQNMIGEALAPMSEAAKKMWREYGEAAAKAGKATEEVTETAVLELTKQQQVFHDVYNVISDTVSSVLGSINDLFKSSSEKKMDIIREEYEDRINAEFEYQEFMSETAGIKTAEEEEYAAFLAEKDEDRKAARLKELADLQAQYAAETDAKKKAELAGRIETLKTAIEEEKLKDASAKAETARKAAELKEEEAWNKEQERLETEHNTAVETAQEELDAELLALKQKQFKTDKALSISQAIIDTASAVINALTMKPAVLGIAMAVAAGVTGGLSIAKIASEPMPMIRGGGVGIEESGVFSGNPGIDTNNVALTTGEYVMPPQQTRDNFDTLESMRAGEDSGGMTITPTPVSLYLDSEKVGEGMLEFITAESDRGNFRINPQVLAGA